MKFHNKYLHVFLKIVYFLKEMLKKAKGDIDYLMV